MNNFLPLTRNNEFYLVGIWLFGLIIVRFPVFAQNNQSIEYLQKQLSVVVEDTVKINLLLKLSDALDDANKAERAASEAMQLAISVDNKNTIALCLHALGRVAYQNHNFKISREYYLKAFLLNDSLNNLLAKSISAYEVGRVSQALYSIDTAAYYYKLAISLADSANNPKGSADYSLSLGILESISGDKKSALVSIAKSQRYYERPEREETYWRTWNCLGIIYSEMGMYAEALQYYSKSYEIAEKMGNSDGMLRVANNLGMIYQDLGKLKKANESYELAYKAIQGKISKYDEALLLNNSAELLLKMGDIAQALQNFREAFDIYSDLGKSCQLTHSSAGIADALAWKGKYDSAKHYYAKALSLAKECGSIGSEIRAYRKMGLLSFKQKMYNETKKYLMKSYVLGQSSGYAVELLETTRELYAFHHSQKNTSVALDYHIQYSLLKDSLFNVKSAEKIARLVAEYDFKKEVQAIEYEKMEKEIILNKKIREKEYSQNGILVVLILTVLLAATLGRSYFLMQNHNKKLKTLNEEKNTLMGVVAHDLRSPLNNIKGLMSLVKVENTNLSPEQKHYFNLVDETMDRMRDMIDRVLNVSVVEDMKVHLSLKKVDLGEALNFVAGNFIPLADKKSIKIHCDVQRERHYSLVDYNYLIQVYENLLSNALKFSESNKSIHLSISNSGNTETVTFKDEGPGISKEDQKKLFFKFQKLSAKPTNNEDSTGLGLSIVKKFIDAMEANIYCKSELDQGSSFIIEFNVIEEPVVVEEETRRMSS